MSRCYIFLCVFFAQQAASLGGSCKHKGVQVLQSDEELDWRPMVLPFFSFGFGGGRRAGCACQLTTPNPRQLCPNNVTMNVTNGQHGWWKGMGMRRLRRHAHHSGRRVFRKNIALKAGCPVRVPLQPCPEKLRRSRRSPHKGGRGRGGGDSSSEEQGVKSSQRGRFYFRSRVNKIKQVSGERMCTDPVTKKTKVFYVQGSTTSTSTVMVTSTVYVPGRREDEDDEEEEDYNNYDDEEQDNFKINTAPIEGTASSFSISPTKTRRPFEPTSIVPTQEISFSIMSTSGESTLLASSQFTTDTIRFTQPLASSEAISSTTQSGGSWFSSSSSSLPSDAGESRLEVLISRDSVTASSTQVGISSSIAVTSTQKKEDQVRPSSSWKTEIPQELSDETTSQSPRRRTTTTEARTTAEQVTSALKESSSSSPDFTSTSKLPSTIAQSTTTEVPSTKAQVSTTLSTTKLRETTTVTSSTTTTTSTPDTTTVQYTRRRITSTEKPEDTTTDTSRSTEPSSTTKPTKSQPTRQAQRESATEPTSIIVTETPAPIRETTPATTLSTTTKAPEMTTSQFTRWKITTAALENQEVSTTIAVSREATSRSSEPVSSTTLQSTRTTGQTFTSSRLQETTSTWATSSTTSTRPTEWSSTSSTTTAPLPTTLIEAKITQQVPPINRPPGFGLLDLTRENKGENDESNEIDTKTQNTRVVVTFTTFSDRMTSPKSNIQVAEKSTLAEITSESVVRWRERKTTSESTISDRNDFEERKKDGGTSVKSELSTSRVETSTWTMGKTQGGVAASTAPSVLLDIVNSGRGEKNNDKTSQSPTMSDLLESGRLSSTVKEITLSTAVDKRVSTQRDSKANEAESSTRNSLLSESKNRTDYEAEKRLGDHDESDMRKYVMFLLMGTSKCNTCPEKSSEKKPDQSSEAGIKDLPTKDSDGGYFYIGYRAKNSTSGANELSVHEKKSDCGICSKTGMVPVKITQLEFDCNSMFKSFFA